MCARCCMSVQGGLKEGGRSMETKGKQPQQGMNKEEKGKKKKIQSAGSLSAQSVSHRGVESAGATASCSS